MGERRFQRPGEYWRNRRGRDWSIPGGDLVRSLIDAIVDAVAANKVVFGAIAGGLVVIVAIGIGVASLMGESSNDKAKSTRVPNAYYLDLSTGQLRIGPMSMKSPMQTFDGHTAVRAFVFACGDCNTSPQYVSYVIHDGEGATPGAMRVAQLDYALGGEEPPDVAVSALQWAAQSDPQGQSIISMYKQQCGDATVEVCRP